MNDLADLAPVAILAAAIVTSGFTLRAASRTASASVQAARHTAQRGAYADLVTAAHDYLDRTRRVLYAAEELDEYAEPSEHLSHDEATGEIFRVRESSLVDGIVETFAKQLNKANDHTAVVRAAAVVALEGPDKIAAAAVMVKQKTDELHEVLSNAGYWPENQKDEPDPARSGLAHTALETALADFIDASHAHLNAHKTPARGSALFPRSRSLLRKLTRAFRQVATKL